MVQPLGGRCAYAIPFDDLAAQACPTFYIATRLKPVNVVIYELKFLTNPVTKIGAREPGPSAKLWGYWRVRSLIQAFDFV